MRSSRSPEHEAAVSRRLALLSAELATIAPSASEGGGEEENPWAAPATHTRLSAGRLGPSPWLEPSPPTRVRPGEGQPVLSEPPLVPLPGRHARRRRQSSLLPEALRGRAALGPAQVAVVGVLVVVALLVTGWWLLRASPREVATPSAPVSEASPLLTGLVSSEQPEAASAASPAVAGGAGGATEVVVDVAGKVRRPGIAVLAAGSRVVDALEAAGGARPGVDLAGLNLARMLVDGEQILVGVRGAPGVAAGSLPGAAPASGGQSGALVPLNTADQTILESLPDVGPVTAQAILAWRDQHGAFTSVDELLEVDGIGEATLARLAPLVTL